MRKGHRRARSPSATLKSPWLLQGSSQLHRDSFNVRLYTSQSPLHTPLNGSSSWIEVFRQSSRFSRSSPPTLALSLDHKGAPENYSEVTEVKHKLRRDPKIGGEKHQIRPRLKDGQERSVELVRARELRLLVVLALKLVAD